MSATQLSELLPLSLSATAERLRRLQERGVITGFGVRVDPAAAGRSIDALVDVRLAPGAPGEILETSLLAMPMITSAMHLTGRFDMQLRVAARDVQELDILLAMLRDELGVEETNTRLVLRVVDGFPRPVPV